MPLLEVNALTIRAGEVTPVREVSFQLAAGERLAIIGRSGAGKSVLGAAIAGLLKPPLFTQSGQILLNGRSLANEVTPDVFYLFQNPGSALSPCLSIRDQVRRVAKLRSRAEFRTAAEEALASVGLSDAAAKFPHQLSGGMRQRVLIAMALVVRPQLLIADEPTTGQDPVTQAGMLDCIDRSLLQTGAALLFITHDLRAAARMCPRALMLDRGEVTACSRWDSLGACSPQSEELVRAVRSLAQ